MRNCKKCGAVIPDNLDACLICGLKAGENAVFPPAPEYSTAPAVALDAKSAARRHPKALFLACLFSCFALIAAAAAVWASQIVPYYISSSVNRAKNAIIYLTDAGDLKFSSPLIDTPELLTQHASVSPDIPAAKASLNGRYIAYLRKATETSGSLYLRDFSAIPSVTHPTVEDILIAENVTDFLFTENSLHIIYLTAGDNGGTLYLYDFSQIFRLDENVAEIIDCADGKLLYTCNPPADTESDCGTLYVGEYTSGVNNRSVVAEDVLELVNYTPALDKFIFTVRQDSGNDVVAVDLKQNMRQTLATGVQKVIESDAKTFAVLYQTSYQNPLHYDNIVNDDLAREDDKIDEPSLDDYPLLHEFYEKNGTDASYEGSMDYEDIAAEDAALNLAVEAYFNMREREKRRVKIRDELDEFVHRYAVLYDLYLFADGGVTRLSESSYSTFDDAKLDLVSGVVSWRETGVKNFDKILFSRYDGSEDIADLLSEKLTDSLFTQKLGSSPIQITLGNGRYACAGWQLTAKTDGIYFAMSEQSPALRLESGDPFYPYHCSLYFVPFKNNALGHIQLIDENVSTVGEMLSGNRLLYYKNVENVDKTASNRRLPLGREITYVGDVFMLSGDEGQRIGESVRISADFLRSENGGKTLLFCERYNSATESGNLFMYTKPSRQLATDVTAFFYRNDSLVYFLRNRRGDVSDLYSFGSDGLVLVENNVAAVV